MLCVVRAFHHNSHRAWWHMATHQHHNSKPPTHQTPTVLHCTIVLQAVMQCHTCRGSCCGRARGWLVPLAPEVATTALPINQTTITSFCVAQSGSNNMRFTVCKRPPIYAFLSSASQHVCHDTQEVTFRPTQHTYQCTTTLHVLHILQPP